MEEKIVDNIPETIYWNNFLFNIFIVAF